MPSLRHVAVAVLVASLAACAAPLDDEAGESSNALQRHENVAPPVDRLPTRAACNAAASRMAFQGSRRAISQCEAAKRSDGRVEITVRLEGGAKVTVSGIAPNRTYPQFTGPVPSETPTGPSVRVEIPLPSGGTVRYGMAVGSWASVEQGPTLGGYTRTVGSADVTLEGAREMLGVGFDVVF